jgi:hypothetical protein
MIFADVIMPFTAAYYAWFLFFPINLLALVSEMVVFKLAYRDLKLRTVILGTLGANAVSLLVGCVLCGLVAMAFMSKKGIFLGGPDSAYIYYVTMGVLFALLLSIYLELRYWQLVYRKCALRSLDRLCALANVVSYSVLIVFVFLPMW